MLEIFSASVKEFLHPNNPNKMAKIARFITEPDFVKDTFIPAAIILNR
ncbi:hypothetical protein C723_0474 [Christiangramia flava JLT2011]|nr:hypothetical protein C723_0474 [Christiangramia flava JLT2011]